MSRRSRMRRQSLGKRLVLTERDLEIFRLLERYRYLNSEYLYAFVGGRSAKRFKERLGDLYHEGFIDRPLQQWDCNAFRFQPLVYELGRMGRKYVQKVCDHTVEYRTYLGRSASRQFAHAFLVSGCLASLELSTAEVPGLRFVPWGEILARAPAQTQHLPMPFRIPHNDHHIIPDGLFGLEYADGVRKSYRFFAVEIDRGTMPIERLDWKQSSLLGKLRNYGELFQTGSHKIHLGIPNLLVLTLVSSSRRLASILQAGEPKLGPQFLFKVLNKSGSASSSERLLTDPWSRAGFDALCIERGWVPAKRASA